MRPSTVLALGLATAASASPIESRAANPLQFEVSNFVFGCTVTCDWSFDVTVPSKAAGPTVSTPVTCSGSTTDKDYKECSAISNKLSIAAYIDKKNQLQLKYEVQKPAKGQTCDYYGHKHVNAATSGRPQKDAFSVNLSKATCVA